jgi:hypothetical protein
MTIKYYYLIMSQNDMIQNQVLEEILRERTSYYISKNRVTDFWTLISPKFIKNLKLDEKILTTNFYNQQKKEITSDINQNFYGSLVSLDKEFINWIQLRLGYFENIDENVDPKLKTKYISDGIIGQFTLKDLQNHSPLECNENLISPDLILKRYKSILNLSYSTSN